MHEWIVLPDFGALAPRHLFAAGAMPVTVVQCAIVVCASLLARRRAARTQEFPPADPRQIWAELKHLRADCATSAADLEGAVAKLKDKALARMIERGSNTHQLQVLQRALDEKASIIGALEQQKAELEVLKERHLLQLHRKDVELSACADALANAEQTIALLRGMLDMPDRAQAPAPRRAIG